MSGLSGFERIIQLLEERAAEHEAREPGAKAAHRAAKALRDRIKKMKENEAAKPKKGTAP